MSVVVFFFLLANLSYFIVLPKTLIAQSNTVALDYGKELLGPVGGIIFAIIVAISCFGALNSQWFTATRLIYVNAAMFPMTVLGAYLNRDPTLLYTPYAQPAHALGISAVVDQQQAGAIMWVLGSSLMVVCGIWLAMSALIGEERRMQNQERRADAALADRLGGS